MEEDKIGGGYMWHRTPQVAGYFYPNDRTVLKKTIEACFLSEIGPGELPKNRENDNTSDLRLSGLISPHAGYIYSGPIAAWGYLRLSYARKPRTIIIAGPNHRGLGPDFAIFPEGIWETPFGEIFIDNEISKSLMDRVEFLKPSEVAHRGEHSIEVQLPFLQYILGNNFKIVPILIYSYDIDRLKLLGKAIGELNSEDILFIASSDFSHYISADMAKILDSEAISYILDIKPYDFLNYVIENRLSICGAGPITSLLFYLNILNVEGRLLKYGNSGEITGDFSEVVAYASISFEKKIERG